MKFFLFLIFLCTLILVLSCAKDKIPEIQACTETVTYLEDMRIIILRNCTDSGCHDGASGVGNYSSYSGMKKDIEEGNMREQVIINRTMPQDDELTPEEFKKFKCWADNGFNE